MGNLFLVYSLIKGTRVGVSLFGKDYLASRPNPAYFLPLLISLLLAQRIGVNSRSTLSLIPGALSARKYDVVSLVEGNSYHEPARSASVKIEILHPVSRTLNDILYPVVSIALTALALITSIRVIVSSVREIRRERSSKT